MNANDQYEDARKRMFDRTKRGEAEKKALIDVVSKTVIVDRLVAPKLMGFHPELNEKDGLRLRYDFGPDTASDIVAIHRHAMNQICAKVGFPMTYFNTLNKYVAKPSPESKTMEDWKRELLCHNLNEQYHEPEWVERGGGPARFLHRIVDGELRGFLSRRYNRHLASAPLLRAFVDACEAKDAVPIEAQSSAVRVSLKFLLPDVFEAFPGEYIGLGSEWSNSDFGAGKLSISQTVWRIKTGTASVLDETLGRVHLGSIIEDSDIEMSDDTAKAEVDAQKKAIRDAVNHQFSVKNVERLLVALSAARDEEIPWSKLKGQLARFLNKADIDWLQNTLDTKGESIIDLPPVSFGSDDRPTPNLYWAASAVSAIAAKTEDADRKAELQREAGKLFSSLLKEKEEP